MCYDHIYLNYTKENDYAVGVDALNKRQGCLLSDLFCRDLLEDIFPPLGMK